MNTYVVTRPSVSYSISTSCSEASIGSPQRSHDCPVPAVVHQLRRGAVRGSRPSARSRCARCRSASSFDTSGERTTHHREPLCRSRRLGERKEDAWCVLAFEDGARVRLASRPGTASLTRTARWLYAPRTMRTTRRTFLTGSFALLAAPPLDGNAQSGSDVRRIGYLSGSSAAAVTRPLAAFQHGLRELGWVEGRNIVIDYRFADGRFEQLPTLAADLVQRKVEVIVATPTPPAVAARKVTGTIPIVMIAVGDPVRVKLIDSLARPGGNVTGLTFDVGLEIFGKELALLKEAFPKIRRVAVLFNASNPAQEVAVNDLKTAAPLQRVQLQFLPVRGPGDFDGAFGAMAGERAEALLVVADSMFNRHRAVLADLATRQRLPSMHGFREYVEAGSLMSYGPSLPEIYRRAGLFIDKILKGAKPADLPVEQPTKFELVINLKTAKALGLTIPPSLLLRADEVIE